MVARSNSFGALALLLSLATCGGGPRPQQVEPAPPTPAREATGRTGGQRLPVLQGKTLSGERFSTAQFAGRRIVVFFFVPGAPEAEVLAPALAALVPLRTANNFELVGIAVAGEAGAAQRFVAAHKLSFPILDDHAVVLARRMDLHSRVGVIVTDASGEVVLGRDRFTPDDPPRREWLEASLRDALRLGTSPPAPGNDLLARPPAPDFERPSLADGAPLRLSALRGRSVVAVFFLHRCPYCHAALRTLQAQVAALPAALRPVLLGVETSGRAEAVAPALAAAGIDAFPVVLDADHRIRDAYGVLGEVPVIVLIDADGGIVFRTRPGWDAGRDPDIVASWLARTVGAPVPMLLPASGYSGSETCGACHALEYATWALTPHASAFDTLATHGAERRDECVRCHVVGFGEPGGYAAGQSQGTQHSDYENVGCESCHGRGGPHRSPGFADAGGPDAVCAGCHDAKHSLGFDLATFRPRVSHTAIAALSSAERQARFGAGRQRAEIAAPGTFVGSEACRECHGAEFATWSESPHARAFASLERAGRASDGACLGCHTTGFGRPGGPDAARAPDPDFARVGCESCHGPGSNHVASGAPRRGTILALRDKCDSCVISQLCGDCHDDANDPRFEFEVQERIERQRHGTLGGDAPAAAR